MKRLSLSFFALMAMSAHARVLEIKRMEEILPEIDSDTLVVFDIDFTLLKAPQMLGSDPWFDHEIEALLRGGVKSESVAEQRAEKFWIRLQKVTAMEPVEMAIPLLVAKLNTASAGTMVLTARETELKEISRRQLAAAGISITGELLHASGRPKGAFLMEFLKKKKLTPKKVVFVDDRRGNATSVDEQLTKAKIPVVAFRYAAGDALYKTFDGDIADCQKKLFEESGVIYSNKDAGKLCAKK